MKNPFDDLRKFRETMESPTARQAREMQELVERATGAKWRRDAQVDLSAILGNTTQSRELLETTIERTFGPAWRDPLAGLRGIAAPFDASFNQFERAITDLAQSAGWFSDDAARIAALEAYSDLIDDEIRSPSLLKATSLSEKKRFARQRSPKA